MSPAPDCHCSQPDCCSAPVSAQSRWLSRVRFFFATILVIGVMARLMGDSVRGISTIYYAMPLQVLAALTALLAVLNWGKKNAASSLDRLHVAPRDGNRLRGLSQHPEPQLRG